ncbi:hypothetical protein [Desulfomonile tiedjei]|uniref:hypothetical protein n=1 Tax=Desulfomonile tiedjei TaxID=2358 RepID=UPI00031868B8|nr:hypothetical protein [Desulfomonile tiedjei]
MLKMKISRAILCSIAVILFFGELSQASSILFVRVPEDRINREYVAKSRQITDSLYANWQQSKFEPLSSEFTPEMQKGLTPQMQRQAFEQIRSIFGDYRGMELVEVLKPRFLFPRGTIYRFKGVYSKSQQPEIRVVFDSSGKVSGMWLKFWKDELQ